MRFLDKKLDTLTPYIPGEQPKSASEFIKLNTNESPYPPSPAVIEAITSAEVSDLNLYSDPDCSALVSAIAEHYGLRAENVFPGNGSDEVLAFCFHGFCEKGAAFADITYGFYKVFAEMFGVRANIVPLRSGFTLDVNDYAGLPGTVFIANPNAPTAICLPLSDIEQLLCQDTRRLVVVDEAYVDFGGESALALLCEYGNLLVVRTMSKSRSLAGARIGYALGSAEIIADLNRMKFAFNPYNLNRLSILAGTVAIQDSKYFEDCVRKITDTRDVTAVRMRQLGFTVTDSRTNFLFAGDNIAFPARDYYEELRNKGILVRYFNRPEIENYVRITVGTPEQMERLVEITEMLRRNSDAHIRN